MQICSRLSSYLFLYFWLYLQIDSSAVVEMEIIESDESDYEVDFSGDRSSEAETGVYYRYSLVTEGSPK